jgi:hypothetical protein
VAELNLFYLQQTISDEKKKLEQQKKAIEALEMTQMEREKEHKMIRKDLLEKQLQRFFSS